MAHPLYAVLLFANGPEPHLLGLAPDRVACNWVRVGASAQPSSGGRARTRRSWVCSLTGARRGSWQAGGSHGGGLASHSSAPGGLGRLGGTQGLLLHEEGLHGCCWALGDGSGGRMRSGDRRGRVRLEAAGNGGNVGGSRAWARSSSHTPAGTCPAFGPVPPRLIVDGRTVVLSSRTTRSHLHRAGGAQSSSGGASTRPGTAIKESQR